MRKTILKIFILFVFSGYVVGQSQILTRSEKIEIFKAEQKCVADASEKEDWSVATPCAKKSLAILEDLLGRDHKSVALITYEYGLSLGYAGNVEESSKVLQQAVKRYNSAHGKNSPELIPILIDFAVAANKLEDFENISPVTIYARAFQIYKESPNFTNLNYANMVADGVNEIIKKNNFIYRSIREQR